MQKCAQHADCAAALEGWLDVVIRMLNHSACGRALEEIRASSQRMQRVCVCVFEFLDKHLILDRI